MEETKDVKETPSSPLVEAIASSPEVEQQVQETQTPAKEEETQEQIEQPEVQEEEPKIPYSRLKEVVDEKNWLKQQLEQQLQRQQTQQQFQQPKQDQYAGMTPEEERFWRMQRQIAREEAEKVTQERMGGIQPVIDAGRMELAQIKVSQFRKDHPDIKPDSQEEIAIAQRIQAGYTPDDAYWSVKGPQGIRFSEQKVKQQVKQQMEAKKKANVENTTSIPQQAQSNTKKSFRDDFLRNFEAAEEKS